MSDTLFDSDGLFDKMYHFLWFKNDFMKEEFAKLKVNLPHTVIFYNTQPLFWYFSDEKGEVKKKKKENIRYEMIEEVFMKNVSKSKVVAYFILTEYYKDKGDLETQNPMIMYFDVDSFPKYMKENLGKFPTGVLQKFVDPIGDKNTLIQAVWSTQVCVQSKRRNFQSLYNQKLNIYEKCCTYDGPEFFSEAAGVTGIIGREITDICNKIVKHIDFLSFGRYCISRLNIILKQDQEGKPWVLWATSLRLTGRKKKQFSKEFVSKPLSLQKRFKIPENIDLLRTVNLQKPLELEKKFRCIKCNEYNHIYDYLPINYKYLVKEMDSANGKYSREDYFKHMKFLSLEFPEVKLAPGVALLGHNQTESSKTDADRIPPIFRRMHPHMGEEEYNLLKTKVSFGMQSIIICKRCFYDVTSFSSLSGKEDPFLHIPKDKIVYMEPRKQPKFKEELDKKYSTLTKEMRSKIFDNRKNRDLLKSASSALRISNNSWFQPKKESLVEPKARTSFESSLTTERKLLASSQMAGHQEDPNSLDKERSTTDNISEHNSQITSDRQIRERNLLKKYENKKELDASVKNEIKNYIRNLTKKSQGANLPTTEPCENTAYLSEGISKREFPATERSPLLKNKSKEVKQIYFPPNGKKHSMM